MVKYLYIVQLFHQLFNLCRLVNFNFMQFRNIFQRLISICLGLLLKSLMISSTISCVNIVDGIKLLPFLLYILFAPSTGELSLLSVPLSMLLFTSILAGYSFVILLLVRSFITIRRFGYFFVTHILI